MVDYDLLKIIDEKSKMLDDLADYIWDNPETDYHEFKSSKALMEACEAEGFEITRNLDGMETAFSARYGSGKPVIGVLGEFDALANLGQEADTFEPKSDGHDAGHGCGHNLLGVGSFGAAIVIKKYLEKNPGKGTVIFYGTPAEEGGSAKAFLARDGVFDELDAAVSWHPCYENIVMTHRNLANCKVLFKFDGKPSHAANSPEQGRSALDAVELMNTGVQYLREHVPYTSRIHYAITDAGGNAPNVVQAHAEVLYLMRAPSSEIVADIYERICNIAKGAALMTGTTESHIFIKACSSYLANSVISEVLQESFEEIEAPVPTEEEVEYFRDMTKGGLSTVASADIENPIHYKPLPLQPPTQKFGSTDVSDVSRVCPTSQYRGAVNAYGTPGHSWQRVAQGKSSYAHKGMRYISKCLGLSVMKMFENPDIIKKAKEEYDKAMPEGYKKVVPDGVKPSANEH